MASDGSSRIQLNRRLISASKCALQATTDGVLITGLSVGSH